MSGAVAAAVPQGVSPLQLRPRLKPHVEFHRHLYRGDVWYVFHDRAVERFYRVSGPAADLIGALDGKRTFAEICSDLQARHPDETLDLQQAGDFLLQLNALGLLRTGLVPPTEALERKHAAIRQRKFMAAIKSPLAIRVPLFDPDRLLNFLAPAGDWIFSRLGAAIWCVVVFSGLGVGVAHWHDLTADFSDRLLSLGNLGMLSLIYPVVKAVHELSHGMAMRRCGAEVRRMGLVFVALMPMPYVDASASVVLRDKRSRMLVGGAGIMAELFIAAIAMWCWVYSMPGTLHIICYNTLLITGLATLLFNGNPLQRYDGYYLLCDLVEIPSLGMRSLQYVGYLMRRYILDDDRARAPAATGSELRWFIIYGILSICYRTWLILHIGLFVARSYPMFGMALAAWSVLGMLLIPLGGLWKLSTGGFGVRRSTAFLRLGIALCVAGLVLFVLPLPLRLVAAGAVWLPDAANVRTRAAGDVARILAHPGQHVVAGQPILILTNHDIAARVRRAKAELQQQMAEQTMEAGGLHLVDAGMAHDRIAAARKNLADAQRDATHLVVRSPLTGTILFAEYNALNGRYLPKGQAPAVIWNSRAVIVRTLVPPEDIDRLRQRVTGVQIRPGFDEHTVYPGHIIRIVPSATQELPSPVLSLEGGGDLPLTAAEGGTGADSRLGVIQPVAGQLATPMFEVDVACDARFPFPFLNGRALVRFDLGTESIGMRLIRWVRLTFLRDLHA